jgi:peptidoglycan/LPS O-acetylase OafA/YrhL
VPVYLTLNLLAPRRNVALDGVRGLAILGVLLTHSTFWFADVGAARLPIRIMALGGKGVDLFFVLSGFLITGILLRTRDSRNRAISFYARRTLRIFRFITEAS